MKSKILGLLAVGLLTGPIVANSAPISIVIPGANTTAPGSTNNTLPFDNGVIDGVRYQQLHDSEQFGATYGFIESIAFRVDDVFGRAFSDRAIDLEIRMSSTTVPVGALRYTFQENVGADEQLLVDGVRYLSSAGTGLFDIVFAFDNPFFYNAERNLLLDVTVFGSQIFEPFDAANSGAFQRAFYNGSGGCACGADALVARQTDNIGLVTQFNFRAVSEPTTLALLGLGLVGMGMRRRIKAG